MHSEGALAVREYGRGPSYLVACILQGVPKSLTGIPIALVVWGSQGPYFPRDTGVGGPHIPSEMGPRGPIFRGAPNRSYRGPGGPGPPFE